MKKENFEKFVEYKKNYDSLQDEVGDAISFIVSELFHSSDGWKFKGDEFNITDGLIEVKIFGRAVRDTIIYNGKEFDLRDKIPCEWIYCDDWVDQLTKGRYAYSEKVYNEQQAKKALIAGAKAKLTKEEQEALGIT